MSDLFEKHIYMDLPSGTDWIDHLDILDAVRINSIGSFKKINEYYPEQLLGYSSAGIKTDSEDYKKALDLLSEAGLNATFLVPNEMLDGYVLLPVAEKDAIRRLSLTRNIVVNGVLMPQHTKINEQESEALEAVWNLYSTDANAKKEAVSAFMKEWDSYPSLKQLHAWWDSLTVVFDITHVGTVLAHTNARRCDKTIPELPLPT